MQDQAAILVSTDEEPDTLQAQDFLRGPVHSLHPSPHFISHEIFTWFDHVKGPFGLVFGVQVGTSGDAGTATDSLSGVQDV